VCLWKFVALLFGSITLQTMCRISHYNKFCADKVYSYDEHIYFYDISSRISFTADESAVPVSVVKKNEEFHLSRFG
jgi:hypothetical protein